MAVSYNATLKSNRMQALDAIDAGFRASVQHMAHDITGDCDRLLIEGRCGAPPVIIGRSFKPTIEGHG